MRLNRLGALSTNHSLFLLFIAHRSWPGRLLSLSLSPCNRLLFPYPFEYLRIPPLPHILMALDPIHQRRFPQMSPPPLLKCKLHIVNPLSPSRLHPLIPHRQDLTRHIYALESGIIAHALKEGHAEAWAESSLWGEYPVGGAFADAVGERFEALTDGDNEGGW